MAYKDVPTGMFPDGPPVLQRPLEDRGVNDVLIIEQSYIVPISTYAPAPLAKGDPGDLTWPGNGTAYPADSNFVLVAETNPEPVGLDLLRIRRTFAKVPPTHVDYQAPYNAQFPGALLYAFKWIRETVPVESPGPSQPPGSPPAPPDDPDSDSVTVWRLVLETFVLREPVTLSVPSSVEYSYVLSETAPDPDVVFKPKAPGLYVVRGDYETLLFVGPPYSSLTLYSDYLTDGPILNPTTPSVSSYISMVQNQTEIVVESGVRRWRGNIWEKWARKVKAK